jgi:hypothetical protein
VDVDNAFNGLLAMNGLLPPQPQSKQLGHITPVFGYLPDPPPPKKQVPIYIVFYVVCLIWKWKL